MYNKLKNKVSLLLIAFLFAVSFITTGGSVQAASNTNQVTNVTDEISITTSLTDQLTTKSEKLTFDLWAKDVTGNKISSSNITVTNNEQHVDVNWDDLEKTSYTLQLDIGSNHVVIQVEHNGQVTSKSYTLIREAAEDGDVIGSFTFSLEAFTVGLGYIIEPIQVDLIKGKNAAQHLDSVINEYGFNYDYTGSLESGFYLSSILNGSNYVYKNEPFIPDVLNEKLEGNYDEMSYDEQYGLGEFDFNYMSGWMYSVNRNFPNVGFADHYLQDGDVMRVQYTLAYGLDIGGADAMGGEYGNFFGKINKDNLTKKIAEINSAPNKEGYLSVNGCQAAYDYAVHVLQKVDADQEEIDAALSNIYATE